MYVHGDLQYTGMIIHRLERQFQKHFTMEPVLALQDQTKEMAELLVGLVPSVEKVRMCNSGTEATMSCIRLARDLPEDQK